MPVGPARGLDDLRLVVEVAHGGTEVGQAPFYIHFLVKLAQFLANLFGFFALQVQLLVALPAVFVAIIFTQLDQVLAVFSLKLLKRRSEFRKLVKEGKAEERSQRRPFNKERETPAAARTPSTGSGLGENTPIAR